MSVEEESTSCYCLLDSSSCHLLLDRPGSYALVGEPLTQSAVKRLKLAVFGNMEAGGATYSLRVYCVDDTPHAFQVGGADSLQLSAVFLFFGLIGSGWVLVSSWSLMFLSSLGCKQQVRTSPDAQLI